MGLLSRLFGRAKQDAVRQADDELLDPLSSSNAETREAAIEPLVTAHLCSPRLPPTEVEDAVIRILASDPDPRVRATLLSQIAKRFVWWADSPIGPIRVALMERILDAIPVALTLATPDDPACYAAGHVIGQHGHIGRLDSIPAPHTESSAFRHGLLDGVARRELEPAAEAIIRHLLLDSDPVLRASAEELLEP